VWLSDDHALPLQGGQGGGETTTTGGENGNSNDDDDDAAQSDTHVCKLWYAGDDIEVSAKLEGAVEGDERRKLWDELNQFLVVDGNGDDNDDDDDDKTA